MVSMVHSPTHARAPMSIKKKSTARRRFARSLEIQQIRQTNKTPIKICVCIIMLVLGGGGAGGLESVRSHFTIYLGWLRDLSREMLKHIFLMLFWIRVKSSFVYNSKLLRQETPTHMFVYLFKKDAHRTMMQIRAQNNKSKPYRDIWSICGNNKLELVP